MIAANADGLRGALVAALGDGCVFDDEASIREYSTDASPCLVPPRIVLRPRLEADVVTIVRACAARGVALTPRAAGTSLSGAAIGPGAILDTSRLAAIREFNAREGWVRVEPSVSIADLNAFLGERGCRFPLEPGSREWCRIGGMLGHNASGYESVKYGQTQDHVLALRVVLADGTPLEAQDVPVDGAAWRQMSERVPALETVRRILADHREAILASRRRVTKHA